MPAHFHISGQISESGVLGAENDDAAGCTRRLAWIIDGATDLGVPDLLGGSGAHWLSATANRLFHESRPEGATIRDILFEAQRRLAQAFGAAKSREPADRWELPFASLSMVRLMGDAIEIGWLGDCVVLLRGKDGKVRRIGAQVEGALSERDAAARLGPLKDPAGKTVGDRALEVLRTGRARKNLGGSSWLLGVEADLPIEVPHEIVSLEAIDAMLLMTDGFAVDFETYHPQSLEAFFAAASASHGLAQILTELRRVEREIDPECRKFPRFKTSDDATAMLVQVWR